ncbi:heterokaryon incompatibility protein-domain-containing protein [Colletotrichum godetiae]|uniref:Heterokaryon incompatibility protein-domain-containing protein n=1 Tax=Colletotrichum godetiae TaxID=1209918 RepID=A0AAJ0EUB2_9PEZI|nr:heterokaryon incompatibility protein-domain-containing protein [Colletotrichum godetiae]KAK1674168.1 heterokaryon incompatibility protein-domain-containing protein [Colletotrichum godetiae]
MISKSMDDIGVNSRVLYAIGAAVILAAPVAHHLVFRHNDRSLLSRLQRWVRPPPQHAHGPLEEGQFRLIHLLPGNEGDEVRIGLTNEWLKAPVKYHAVSYAWGDARDNAYITCEGKEIQITRTLFEALKRWRLPTEEVVLWADSICIDQRNTLEKTHQIGRMSEIYSNAESVRIWLGSDDSQIDGVQDVIKEACQIIPDVVDDPQQNRKSADILATRNQERTREGKTTVWSLDWKPLRALMNHTWFERKWVYQEAILNDNTWLYCGKLMMPFQPLSELALRMSTFGIQALPKDGTVNDSNVTFLPIRLYNLSMMRMSQWYRGKQPVTLMDGVKATRAFQCTDPRDHILGVLGYASDFEKDSIISRDNLYSLSVQECYLRFARSQLLEKKNLGVLASAPQRLITDVALPWYYRPIYRWKRRRLPGLPTWVPDLRNQELDALPSYSVRYGKFSAGGTQCGRVEIIGNKILRCSGMIVDTIQEDGVFWPELPLPPKPKRVPYPLDKMDVYYARNSLRSLEFYKSCVRIASGSDRIQDMSPERLADFWKTLTSERSQLSDRVDVDLSESVKTMITNMETWLVSEDPEEANKARLSFVAAAVQVEMTILAAASPRRFSRTTAGRLCLVPREAKVGDSVCLLLGSEVPFVIRPTRSGMYELIGDAYVSGIMDGEAVASGEYTQAEIEIE